MIVVCLSFRWLIDSYHFSFPVVCLLYCFCPHSVYNVIYQRKAMLFQAVYFSTPVNHLHRKIKITHINTVFSYWLNVLVETENSFLGIENLSRLTCNSSENTVLLIVRLNDISRFHHGWHGGEEKRKVFLLIMMIVDDEKMRRWIWDDD